MFVVTHEPIVSLTGQPQKKGVNPNTQKYEINPVKDAFSVNLSPAPLVTNILSAAGLLVGIRLPEVWQVWAAKDLSVRGVLILKEGYILLFKIKPPLARKPDKEANMQIPQEHLHQGDIAFPPKAS